MQKNKKIAVLMLCHILPGQINEYINGFNEKAFDFFLHIDKKSVIQPLIQKKESVYFVPDDRRVDVRWGTYSMVQATLELINLAMQNGSYDYYWLCSGQDFPIHSSRIIEEFFKDKECNFISFSALKRYNKRCEIVFPTWLIGKSLWQRILKKSYCIVTGGTDYTFKVFKHIPPLDIKLYFGSQWWCLNSYTIRWLTDYIDVHNEICEFYKNTLCPDESFFHTLVMASPYAGNIKENLVYFDWSENKNSPKILTMSDYEIIKGSGKLIARKIDSNKDPVLYNLLVAGYLEDNHFLE